MGTAGNSTLIGGKLLATQLCSLSLSTCLHTTYFTSPLIYVFLISNCVLYTKVFISYKKTVRKIRSKTLESSDAKSRKITKTALIVNTLLVIGWTPLAIVSGLPPPTPTTHPNAVLAYIISYEGVFIFLLLPAFLNNIIYALQHNDYRVAYMKILNMNTSSMNESSATASSKTHSTQVK